MNIVSHLLSLIPEDRIRLIGNSALDQVGQKAVQFRARVVGAGKAPAAETDRAHAEISPVFLDQHVGGDLGRAEEAVQGAVYTHALVDAALEIRMIFGHLPTGR